MREIATVSDLKNLVGSELGVSDWTDITQARIDAFADVTGDHQWIHTDPERAKSGPYGATIAHGYLTLALGPSLTSQVWRFSGVRTAINYGLNRVRFIAPVPVGARLRARVTLDEITEIVDGVQVQSTVRFEIQGSSRPVCIAQNVGRYLFERA